MLLFYPVRILSANSFHSFLLSLNVCVYWRFAQNEQTSVIFHKYQNPLFEMNSL